VSTRGHGPSNQPSSMRPSNGTSNQPSSVIPLDVCSTKASIIIDSVGGLPLVDKEHWYKGATEERYNAFVPHATWWRRCYSKYMKSIRDHQDNEVKKRGVEVMKIDVSYKGAAKIKRVNGQKIVSGIVSLMNGYNEQRSQWYVTTDAKDQYIAPLTAMAETCAQLGHEGPRIAYVDNPAQSGWLLDFFPSLQETQKRYDKIAAEMATAASSENEAESTPVAPNRDGAVDADVTMEDGDIANTLPDFDEWFQDNCTYLQTSDAIDTNAAAIMEVLRLDDDDTSAVVVGLDLEWNVPMDNWGNVIGPGKKTGLIQIAYKNEDSIKVVLYQVNRLAKLPPGLVALLEHPKIRFAGCQVGGDIAKTNRDFGLHMDKDSKAINLAGMALARGICLSGKGLDSVAEAVIGKQVDKTLQKSAWNQRPLPPRLQKYAAKDAYYSLEIYRRLGALPDLTMPPLPAAVTAGLQVDIAPYLSSGTIFNAGCCAAIGTVVADSQEWDIPNNLKAARAIVSGRAAGRYLVEVTSILTPSLKIKEVFIKGTRRYATLGEIGVLPARVMLPIEMLREHVPARKALAASTLRTVLQHGTATNAPLLEGNAINDIFDDGEHGIDDDEIANERDESNEGAHCSDEGNYDNEAALNLTEPLQISEIERCLKLAHKAIICLPGDEWAPREGVHLDPPPEKIEDRFSALLGSAFHASHRIIVGVKHSHKKAFYVALSEAIYAWDEEEMAILVENLKLRLDLDDDEIRLFRYFRRRYFAKRVRRHCLPPSRLYWRVRAVFEVFGPKVDPKTSKSLFNTIAWTKAKGVLKEMLRGFYSDPPGEIMYKYELLSTGEIKRDGFGIAFLRCDRDTNALEGEHSNISDTFGSHSMGLEFADNILAERRHRCNIKASKKNRLDFPNIGHFDTWMIDALQKKVEENHQTLLYETWTCASDYAQTSERFGFVTLASPELKEQINGTVQLPPEYKMPPSLKFLSEQIGCIIAPQPWATTYEIKTLFPRLLLNAQHACPNDEDGIDDHICTAILPYVNGTTVTPKLPVYCRLFRKRYTHNHRVREAAKSMAVETAALEALNILTVQQPQSESLSDVEMDTGPAGNEFQANANANANANTNSTANANANTNTNTDVNTNTNASSSTSNSNPNQRDSTMQTRPSTNPNSYIRTHFGHRFMTPMPAMMPTRFPVIQPNNYQPVYRTHFVGGMPISSGQPSLLVRFDGNKFRYPFRGSDKKSRKKRTCKRCGRSDCEGAKIREE
jgi:hypothetical protein